LETPLREDTIVNSKNERFNMSNDQKSVQQPIPQPQPVTPGITIAMVRQHAFKLYNDKLERGQLTLEDWVLAEKDLVQSLQSENA